MTVHRPDPETDPFRPPAIPTEVFCLHCQQEYESYLMEWREQIAEGKRRGFWCCPTEGCDGKGFGFDIFPIDPDYRDENGEPLGPFADDEEGDQDSIDQEQWSVLEDEPPWGDPIDADALLEEDADSPDSPEPPTLGPPINLNDLDDEPGPPASDRQRWNDDDLPW